MSEVQNNNQPLTEEEKERVRRRRELRLKIEKKRKRRQRIINAISIVVILLILSAGGLIFFGKIGLPTSSTASGESAANEREEVSAAPAAESESTAISSEEAEGPKTEAEENPEASGQTDKGQILSQADYYFLTYDYDRAVEILQTIDGYENDSDVQARMEMIQNTVANLVPWDMNNITHIFYHSLIVDPNRAFNQGNSADAGFKQWMTTIYEFDQITQQMYDRGYVLISLYDMVNQTIDENGQVHFTPNQLYLPEGKIPYVLSLDDLSYYHSYNGRGTASRMIIGDDGKPTCEYVDADGNTLVGPYDCIPRMDAFLAQHPDASYRGAKGTIALTGYDGILGYRTDIAYKTWQDLDRAQEDFLNANPDFNWEQECAQAQAVAECIKADGWTFASHTWGHMRVGDGSMERLTRDTENWKNYVAPLIGGSDIIIFAHGQDLGDAGDYAPDNEKFNYLKSQGFNFYCNVDSSQYFLQIRDNYVRQGRRNLDGYRLWNDVYGSHNRTSDLIDAASCLDPVRTDMPDL